MTQLQIFNYNDREVRSVQKGGDVWWVLKDVCDILDIKNPTQAADRLDEDERAMFNIGRQGETNIISESGLYNIILRSDKPEAKSFKRWVTHDVLPTIRKHGMYAADELLDNPDLLIGVATKLKEERTKNLALGYANLQLTQKVAEYEPKVQYLDRILQSQGVLAITQIAADYGLSANRLNKILHEAHVQHNIGGQWILYKEHMNLGYTKSETIQFNRSDGRPDTKLNTKWTQKGRLLIHNLLNERGIMANMDSPKHKTGGLNQ